MNPRFVHGLLAVYRQLAQLERDSVCCGTVTVSQCFALQLLHEKTRDNGELAKLTGVNPSSATRLVDGLVRRGWAKRTQNVDDRRHTLVELTEPGAIEARRLAELTSQCMGDLLRAVPKAKHAQVIESIELIAAALRQTECCP